MDLKTKNSIRESRMQVSTVAVGVERHHQMIQCGRSVSTGVASRMLDVTRTTILRWIDEGLLEGFRPAPGKHYRVKLASIYRVRESL
jgi:excisionase family DNA binding protein